jgi:hypothetical protein
MILHCSNEDCSYDNWSSYGHCISGWRQPVDMDFLFVLLLLGFFFSFVLSDQQGTIFYLHATQFIHIRIKHSLSGVSFRFVYEEWIHTTICCWQNLMNISFFFSKIAIKIIWIWNMNAFLVLWKLHCFSSGCVIISFISGDALIELRKSLNGSSQQLSDWNENQVNPCTWSRVNCDVNSNVIQV